jgi:N6-adenosine-specific RNA methylase IME4
MQDQRPAQAVTGGIANHLETLRGGYRVVAADPPWKFKSNSTDKPGRNAARHYATMPLADICAMPVKDLVAKNAILFLWITGPFLSIGAHLPLMKAWGFKPSGMGFVWVKLRPRAATLFVIEQDLATGGGFTTRKNAEFCLIGKRGRSVRECRSIHEVIIEPRREHSRKPEQFYERAEAYAAGPRLELFARQTRPGWDAFGLESTKFDPPPDDER